MWTWRTRLLYGNGQVQQPASRASREERGRQSFSLGPMSVLSISRGAISIYFNENKTPRTGPCVFFRDGACFIVSRGETTHLKNRHTHQKLFDYCPSWGLMVDDFVVYFIPLHLFFSSLKYMITVVCEHFWNGAAFGEHATAHTQGRWGLFSKLESPLCKMN